ncbi:MAG: prolipoprotein diacylglyceryl transferase [Clostridiales Family XIII bacterium]|jgi:phosphatidylglycerol:prolipoprotein diacylglycerol transferase|nr:prolipoprotein diacylglyceryl transferase [Clostridiales Family XIII bacterium]
MNLFDSTPDRVAFSIGGIDVMWYGVLIACGFALCIYMVCKRAPRHGITGDKALNYAIFVAVAGIIGARLYYILFKLPYYLEDPVRMFQIREGGLAIHGGLIAGCLVAIVLCRRWRDNPLNIMDLFFVSIPLGQAIGRWGNYFNGEAHGGPTDLPWGIMVDGEKVHPTFLYESLWCLLMVFILWYVDNRRTFRGQTFLLYCILYSAERFLVEGLRTDSLMLASLKQAQLLSVIVIVGSVCAYYYLWKKHAASGEPPEYDRYDAMPDDDLGAGAQAGAEKDSGDESKGDSE